jgi:hypothetical protein
MKVGGDYRYMTPERRQSGAVVNIMADNLHSLLAGRGLWLASSKLPRNQVLAQELSLYLQDSWRLRSRVTLTYGVRWEWGPPPTVTVPSGETAPLQTVPIDNSIWKVRLSNLSPRIGLAWRLGKSESTVLRAGAGLYFDSSLAVTADLLNVSALPYALWQVANPVPEVSGPARSLVRYGFAPDLRLPQVWQANLSLEHAVTPADTVSISLVASQGQRLLRREVLGDSINLSGEAKVTNHASSSYKGLQLQWRRRMTRNIQANLAYAWSHSIDTASSDAVLHWIGPTFGASGDRGSSDFDVRHSLNLAFRLESPGKTRWSRGWALDGVARARSGFPITVLQSESAMGVAFANAFRPNVVPGQAIWLNDPAAPGGRRLNPQAFVDAPGMTQGSLGRNAIAGFGMAQIDASLSREFGLGEFGRAALRLEAFNVTNHANFADPLRYLASPLFGQAVTMQNLGLSNGTSASGLNPLLQMGGPRSIQLSLRWQF